MRTSAAFIIVAPEHPPVTPILRPPLHVPRPSRRPSHHHSWQQRVGLALLILFAAVSLVDIAMRSPSHFRVLKNAGTSLIMAPAYAPRAVLPSIINGELADHLQGVLSVICKNINPNTYLAYSFVGDQRLEYWSVVYDNAMRAMVHLRTGQIGLARKVIDYFIDNTAIQKAGWVEKNGVLTKNSGWIIDIVDASEDRPGGRGVEHVAHTGPNAYLGIASLHLYQATQVRRYLEFARKQWTMLEELQNKDPRTFNYGGIRMGPMGNPDNPQEQRLEFNANNPSFYDFYNGEHAADFKAFSDLMAQVDPEYRDRYSHASALITDWDKKIYDTSKHLFFIGTTEKPYFDRNIGRWVMPGIIPMYPLDTNALKISAYGVDGMEVFETNAAEKIRQAIDDKFKVTVGVPGRDDHATTAFGYDFVGTDDRPRLIRYTEAGPYGQQKIRQGKGRSPLLSDEWSNWVALADLRLADDFDRKGLYEKGTKYINAYYKNALLNGLKTAYPVKGGLAYPYAHPLDGGLNQSVGFGWNTHHMPYALIGGEARVLGALRFDPFRLNGGQNSLSFPSRVPALAPQPGVDRSSNVLYTEAELYLRDAWRDVRTAQINGPHAETYWRRAIAKITQMLSDHEDWMAIAKNQNQVAECSEEPYPLLNVGNLTPRELEPVFRKYWALYHVGAAEFILVLSYAALRDIAREQGDTRSATLYDTRAQEAASRILNNYRFSQTYDERGWLWQPAIAVRQLVDVPDGSH